MITEYCTEIHDKRREREQQTGIGNEIWKEGKEYDRMKKRPNSQQYEGN